jgi:hypothetical protein
MVQDLVQAELDNRPEVERANPNAKPGKKLAALSALIPAFFPRRRRIAFSPLPQTKALDLASERRGSSEKRLKALRSVMGVCARLSVGRAG